MLLAPDIQPPTVDILAPADGSGGVSISVVVAIFFSEAIQRGTGSITIRESYGAIFALIPASSTSLVTLSGKTVTISLGAPLAYTTSYFVDIPAGAFTDLSGNPFAGLSTYDFTTAPPPDTAAPTIALQSSKSVLKAGDAALITFTLSEPSANFIEQDVTVSGGTLSNFSGSGVAYTATFTAALSGVTAGGISVVSGKFSDAAGNVNVDGADADNAVSIPIDTTIPTIALSSNMAALKAGELATITFTLSEPSANFTGSDVSVTGGTLTGFSGLGSSYTATLSLATVGMVAGVVKVLSGVFTDIAGNANADGADDNNTLTITPANSTPTGAMAVSGTAEQGQTLTLSHTLVDADGLGSLAYQWLAEGQLIAGATGPSLVLAQAQVGKVISVRASYTDQRGNAEQVISTATAIVLNVNDAPVANALSLSTNEDTAQTSTLTASDIDSTQLTYAKASDPTNGTVAVNANGTFTYTPALNFNGADSFTFKASDGSLESAAAAITITVTPVNDAPIAHTLAISTSEDTAQTGTLSGSDMDSANLTYTKASDPTNGTVAVNANGTFTYTPALNFNGTDSFTFKASDGSLESTAATVTITVSAVNDAPVASTLTISTNEDITQTGALTATDIDSATLTYAKVSDPANGTVTVNASGTFTYTPALNFNGTDSFTFKASDGSLESAAATVTITVNAVNDPATGSLLITGTPGQGLTLQANLASFLDVDGASPPNQSIRYEWRADDTVIANVSGPDLFLAPALTGKSITARAHFKDGLGTDEFVASSPSGPVLPGSISGEVRYWHGNEPVATTQIRMLDSDSVASPIAPIAQASSTADGRWSVPQLDFDTFAVKASRAVSATDHSSVSAGDVLAALKLSVGRTPHADPDGPGPVVAPAASPYQMIASEVITDGVVRSDDAMLILHAALNPASSPIWHWSFIAEGQDLSAVSRHATFIDPPPSVSVVNGTTSNWMGILLGDVDGSWNPGALG